MVQPFFNRQQIASFAQVITDSAREMLAHWQSYAESGTPFDINSEMLHLTLGIESVSPIVALAYTRAASKKEMGGATDVCHC